MSTKKLIKELMDKLSKLSEDSAERDDLEYQILRLVEQEEQIENMTKLDPIPPTSSSKNLNLELDEKEKIRLERQIKRQEKEEQYKLESKLESKEEELLRAEMMKHELASNNEYAFRKERKPVGAKNKNKSKK